MGLAPYGKPIYEDKIKKLIDIKEDGTFKLDQKYFNYATGLTMINKILIIFWSKTSRFKKIKLHNSIWMLHHQFKKLLKKL